MNQNKKFVTYVLSKETSQNNRPSAEDKTVHRGNLMKSNFYIALSIYYTQDIITVFSPSI
jgi:hypothetical protein